MSFVRRLGPLFALMAAPALLATIAASYTAFWFYHASQMKGRLAAWTEERRAEGHTVSYTVDGTSGFPIGLTIDLKAVQIDLRKDAGAWSLHTPALEISSGVFSPRTLSLSLPKGAQLAVTRPDAVIRLDKTQGAVNLDLVLDPSDHVRGANLTLKDVRFGGTWKGVALASPLIVGEAKAAFSLSPPATAPAPGGEPPTSARFDAMLRDLRWPANLTYGLGADLAGFDVSARVTGPIARGAEPFDALGKWREAGGKASVDRIALKWGQSSLAGYGTLVMDEALQPAASLTARIEGFVPLVDVLEEADLIRASDATLARLVIGRQMPRTGPGNLSLSLRDGLVYAGPLALVQVPRLDWPQMEKKPTTERRAKSGGPLLQPGIDIGRDGAVDRQGNPIP